MLHSLLMAFSSYSSIPVPQTKWDEKSMRYCICFLPLVGAVIGAVQFLAFLFLERLSFGKIFSGAVLAALPVLLSGGIHMDGFLDTCDAVHSYGSREKRLEILKDPHVGAFAVIGGILYFALSMGVWSEAGSGEILTLCLIFPFSRALSAFAAVTFPKAKKDGMLRQETDPAAKGSAFTMAAFSVLTGIAIIGSCTLTGTVMVGSGAVTGAAAAASAQSGVTTVTTGVVRGVTAVLASMAVFLYYRGMSAKLFGGTTGDLSGWFTQTCELVAAGAVIVVGRLF